MWRDARPQCLCLALCCVLAFYSFLLGTFSPSSSHLSPYSSSSVSSLSLRSRSSEMKGATDADSKVNSLRSHRNQSYPSLASDKSDHEHFSAEGHTAVNKMRKEARTFSGLVGWSSDFHISTVKDIKDILNEFGVRLIDKSLSGHCHLTGTCQKDLKVINKYNGIDLSSCPNNLKRNFFEAYKNDKELNSVDFFLCTHAASMCEIFMPFNKPIIVVSSTRYEIGRHDRSRWQEWNGYLRLISSRPGSFVGANNRYDQEYVKYFSGVPNVLYLPSLCRVFQRNSKVPVTYQPSRPEVLIAPSRDFPEHIANELISVASGNDLRGRLSSIFSFFSSQSSSQNFDRPSFDVKRIRDLYPHFEYEDLAAHPAAVVLPYQISFMMFFELYSMNIPLFVPSPALLAKWHLEFGILKERTWSSVHGHPEESSVISKHPQSTSSLQNDPNNEFDLEAVQEWISLSDFYQFPFVTQFESIDDCVDKIVAADLLGISNKMKLANEKRESGIMGGWSHVLSEVARERKGGVHSVVPNTINEALRKAYSIELNDGCLGYHELDTI